MSRVGMPGVPSSGVAADVLPHSLVSSSGFPPPTMATSSSVCVKQEVLEDLASYCDTESMYAESEMGFSPATIRDLEKDDRRCFVKLLISHNVAGCVIGRGGEVMDCLKQKTGVKVFMSKTDECYPASTDRVCALTGTPKEIYDAIGFIIKKITIRRQGMVNCDDENAMIDDDFILSESVLAEVHFVVPDPTARAVIGLDGQVVRELNEREGGNVSVSYKQFPREIIEERRISCHGRFSYVMGFVKTLINFLVDDPMHDCFPHVVYRGKIDMTLPPRGSSTNHVNDEQQRSPDAAKVTEGSQLALALLGQGVKNTLDDEMFGLIRSKLNKMNGDNLTDTSETMASLSLLSKKGLLCLVPGAAAGEKKASPGQAREGVTGLQLRGVPEGLGVFPPQPAVSRANVWHGQARPGANGTPGSLSTYPNSQNRGHAGSSGTHFRHSGNSGSNGPWQGYH